MSKLRWTLLILGGLFILALALWERWRPRQARGRGAQRRATTQDAWAGGPAAMDGQSDEPTAQRRATTQDAWVSGTLGHEDISGTGKRGPAVIMEGDSDEPTAQRRATTQDAWVSGTLGHEDISGTGKRGPAVIMEGDSDDPAAQRRATTQDAWDSETPTLEAASGTGTWGPAVIMEGDSDDPAEPPGAAAQGARAESLAGDEHTGEFSRDGIDTTFPGEVRVNPVEPWIGEPGLAEAASMESGLRADRDSRRVGIPGNSDESPTAELPVLTEAAVDDPAPQALEETLALEGLAPVEPIVRWPPEALRQIVALRLVAPPERFPGRALRLALAAEGFLLGKFDIFHKPDRGRRAVVSAASLTRPGTFDLDTMDSQRYPGLSLFVVLPGPRPGQQAFDELVDVAQNLCERLQGELQNAQGEALTQESIQTLRAALPASAGGGTAS